MDHLEQIDEGVFFVRGENKGKFPACHGLLLKGKETVLIDAGMGEEVIKDVDRANRIDVLLITHSHPDHIRGWRILADRHLLLPKETPDVVTDLVLLGERFMGSREEGEHWAKFVNSNFGVTELREPDERYGNGDVLRLGGAELEAIHAPGHLDDHYCFLERKSGTLFTTDIDLTSFGPWYGNVESSIELFKQSIRKIMELPRRRVCTSHHDIIEGQANDEFEAYLAAFDRQKKKILRMCSRPLKLEQLVNASPFYGNMLGDKVVQDVFERNMIRMNLDILLRDGLIEERQGYYMRKDR